MQTSERSDRMIEWGVMDSDGRVTQCPDEQDARRYQMAHGGELVSLAAIRTTW